MKVSMIGLGKLGLACAEQMAHVHDVAGYDIVPMASQKVYITKTLQEAVEHREIIFIAVPTPHHELYDGSTPMQGLPAKDFDYSVVTEVLKRVISYASPESDIVLISTVLPGTVQRELAQLAPDHNLIYNPYFIAMGTVGEDFLKPDFQVIGTKGGNHNLAKRLVEFYQTMLAPTNFHVGTWTEAECVKVFYNTFISFKLSFVNMIQDVAMRLGDTDSDFVTAALSDSKKRLLSPMYMKAGMGDGGPCHPRDNIALRCLSQRLDLGYDLFSSVVVSREEQARNLASYLVSWEMPVVILGTAFKPGVALTDGSYSLLVGHFVAELGQSVDYWDPLISTSDTPPIGKNVYLLAHEDSRMYSFPYALDSVVIDPWRRCPLIDGVKVIHYGNTREA